MSGSPRDNVIREKAYGFALATMRICRELRGLGEYDLSRQLFKAGTSIGANVEEAQAAQSRADFLSKMSIASKEAREAHYWLNLIADDEHLRRIAAPRAECDEIVSILTAIVKRTGEA
jgi:four helix bundle protein